MIVLTWILSLDSFSSFELNLLLYLMTVYLDFAQTRDIYPYYNCIPIACVYTTLDEYLCGKVNKYFSG